MIIADYHTDGDDDVQRSVLDFSANMMRYSTKPLSNWKIGINCLSALSTEFHQPIKRNVTSSAPRSSSSLPPTKSPSNPQGLPHYPLPSLQSTLQKYLKTVEPVLSADELKKTVSIINEFGSTNGHGEKLHAMLKKRADSHENWLSDWWLKYAYLGWRSPVVVYSNPGLFFEVNKFANQREWLNYAAQVIWASLRFKQMIDRNEIQPDRMGKSQLDMGQYGRIFGTCRIPNEEFDKIEFNPKSKHVIVAYKNGYFKLPVYSADSEEILSESEILTKLESIVTEENKSNNKNPSIGLLTTMDRDSLAKAYSNLISQPENKQSIDIISKGLFVVCLDRPVKLTGTDEDFNIASHQFIHGGGADLNSPNRWYDKTLQLIVNENGLCGLNYEHSPGEGQPIAVLSDFIINHTKSNKSSENKSSTSSSSSEPPTKLPFKITPTIENDLEAAAAHITKLSSNLDLKVLNFQSYGKSFIKSQKMSPDSYLQIAMQYAFYKLHGVPGAHYETAQQRLFVNGRTETIRSCSNESIAFAKAMCSNDISDAEKVIALKAAVNGHKNYALMAMQGDGVDRHLLGLKLTAIENGLKTPELFSDSGYIKSTHYRISTSQVASAHKVFMCYGPAVDDGYGLCYNPRDSDMLFAISSFKSGGEKMRATIMAKALADALDNMYRLLSRAGEKPKSKI